MAWLVSAMPAGAQSGISGLWDARIVANQLEIPFRFEIAQSGTQVQGFFFEGDRKIASSSGSFANNRLELNYDYLDTTLDVTFVGDQFFGTYRVNRPGAQPLLIRAKRFTPAPAETASAPQVAGNWEMRRLPEEIKTDSDRRTWNLFLRQSGAEVSGSILRVDGDTGFLTGRWQNGQLVLSHFAGQGPLLFEARVNKDGTLSIALNRSADYVAVRKSEARAKGVPDPPDPTRYTSVKDPTVPFQFSFPDMQGKIVSNTDARFKGKVVLLAIGGSWCPNCQDEAPFLVDLYKEFQPRGLEIVGLMFEADDDPALARRHIQTFVKRFGIPYTMLLAGTVDNINQKLPELVNFGAYPTTIFLGRDGRVRSVHAGFASQATGQEYLRLKTEVRGVVQRLLTENRGSAGQSSAGF
ncbi:MAG TPA: TlpA disulfide reductase family protein [Candidatus Acidoferrales bacterium]|jgi:peroxiredoxin|nr:TlpA disulfide reductase family protein [Candidatus Acidoferrales bacterium]